MKRKYQIVSTTKAKPILDLPETHLQILSETESAAVVGGSLLRNFGLFGISDRLNPRTEDPSIELISRLSKIGNINNGGQTGGEMLTRLSKIVNINNGGQTGGLRR
ncbi:hypothetical protein BJP34_08940 [Moorena producens PAL-8-15-08-1]|uniref:Uncharacterized protein n=1 Tax=Moorena producens PAL-8-15-08-1 TaxID=1458985 RepID=A0A1D8TPS1_9CYAN|nr:hypothetical protein BJP34_08940 [Moorena producens PAL-8-15-08-1]